MICSFDTQIAERFGLAAAVIFNNIRNAVILHDDDKFPSWELTHDYFYYIHRFLNKKQVDDALIKLERNGYIQARNLGDGRISIETARLYS